MANIGCVRGCSGFDRSSTVERLCGDPTLLVEIASIYVGTAPGQLQAIGQALAARDLAGIYNEAHSLKGSTSIFEAPAAVASIIELESAARSGNHRDIASLASRAEALVRDLIKHLQDPEILET